jgi:RNA polymerase sigma-70 factor (ECF subfamily)
MDRDLVLRAQGGDADAFRELAMASHARLFKVAHGIVRDRHLAEDATQQALLRVWRYIRRLRDPDNFEAWSYRIVVHACYAERDRRIDTVAEAGRDSIHEPASRDDYQAIADRDQLERAFGRLSLEHRAVVVLHHLVGLPLEQVADTLEIRVGTVKSRLHRAMTSLRAAVEADDRVPDARAIHEEAAR